MCVRVLHCAHTSGSRSSFLKTCMHTSALIHRGVDGEGNLEPSTVGTVAVPDYYYLAVAIDLSDNGTARQPLCTT